MNALTGLALLLLGFLDAPAVPAVGPASGPSLPPDAAVELRYQGSFAKVNRDGEPSPDPAKRFELFCLSTPRAEGGRDVAFVLDEHGGGAWPWPARFGAISTDAKHHPTRNRLRLLQEHEGTQYVLAVPFPYFEFADKLAAGARWEAPRTAEVVTQRDTAPWRYKVASSKKVGARDCWRVDVVNNFGPQESLWIEKGSPLVVKAERRIVIGRGDVHLLKMELESAAVVNDESLAKLRRPLDGLLKLQQQLKKADDDQSAELTEAQIKTAASALGTIEPQSEGTPFDRLVAAIRRDVSAQSHRTDDVGSLAKRFIGKPSPPLTLKTLDQEAVDPAQHAGKIVLLHFWSYQGEPFPPEPYGQVGYLDYLHNRRRKLGLQVYGVAVNPKLADKAQTAAVVRSIRKLQSFMNLSYPLTIDDGSLLEKFGDPQRVGARLPLWVLVDGKGTVIEYKVGTFDIKSDEGLSQLDKTIVAQIRKQRKNPQPN